MKRPLLSIGMIIKNEIHCLERCLKSLEPLRQSIPCELVIADTGSDDGSREIAAQYADLLFDFKWINDFAAARNAVLEQCTGEWYLTIDADEWLENIDELVGLLRGEIHPQGNIAMLYQRNYANRALTAFSDSPVPRLGKRLGGALHYVFPIHEVPEFMDGTQIRYFLLAHTYLHHDGYLDEDADKRRAKNERNMSLLRIEQQENPKNLRILTQCLQSAVDQEETRKYLRIAQGIVCSEVARDPFCPVLLNSMIARLFNLKDYRQLDACLNTALDLCPQSYMIRLDGYGYRALAAFFQEDWENVVGFESKWEQALEELEAGADQAQPERLYGAYGTRDPGTRTLMYTLNVCALAQLGEHKAAAQQLSLIELDRLSPRNSLTLMTAVLMGAVFQPQGTVWLRDFWDYIQGQIQSQDHQQQRVGHILKREVLAAFDRQLCQVGMAHEMAQALAAMGDCLPGQAGKILLAESEEEIHDLLSHNIDWPYLLPEAYFHIMTLHLPMPDAFYRQPSECMAQITAKLAERPTMPMTVQSWLAHSAPAETPGELTWKLDLVTAALRSCNWEESPRVGESLCGFYTELSSAYLNKVYNPALLNEDTFFVLPGMQRFAWRYQQALAARVQGDELGYVRALQAGLETAPAMKGMVDFLVQRLEQQKKLESAPPELLELAEKVRSILAQYSPDNPVVVALKQSEVYQRVAYLIEGWDAHSLVDLPQ